jgi:hypothetical protein
MTANKPSLVVFLVSASIPQTKPELTKRNLIKRKKDGSFVLHAWALKLPTQTITFTC